MFCSSGQTNTQSTTGPGGVKAAGELPTSVIVNYHAAGSANSAAGAHAKVTRSEPSVLPPMPPGPGAAFGSIHTNEFGNSPVAVT